MAGAGMGGRLCAYLCGHLLIAVRVSERARASTAPGRRDQRQVSPHHAAGIFQMPSRRRHAVVAVAMPAVGLPPFFTSLRGASPNARAGMVADIG